LVEIPKTKGVGGWCRGSTGKILFIRPGAEVLKVISVLSPGGVTGEIGRFNSGMEVA
jgi:hypothetical protein